MKWLTDKARIQQSDEENDWYLADNELYQDDDGCIYLIPRNYKTDNYTIPDWIAWLAGGKSKWDVRPSHIHDFGCQYHQIIKVNLTEVELKKHRYLKSHIPKKTNEEITVCEDIPDKYLELVTVTKWEIDCLFKRAMKSTGIIPARVYNLYRCGVFFNFGWLGNHPPYNLNKIYTKEGDANG